MVINQHKIDTFVLCENVYVFRKVDIIINYINLSKIIDDKKEDFTKGRQARS